jgi:hypothetical protein
MRRRSASSRKAIAVIGKGGWVRPDQRVDDTAEDKAQAAQKTTG